MTKFKLSKKTRRRICLYASSAAAVVSGLSILSAIGYCELGVIGVGEMLMRAIVSLILLTAFTLLAAAISAAITRIETPKPQRHISNKVAIFHIEPEKKQIRKLVIWLVKDNIKSKLKALGITLYELSQSTDIKYELLRRTFNGTRKLTADELVKILSVTGIRYEEVM